jgi:glycosyltransferase involved in cell wall biosynthesis
MKVLILNAEVVFARTDEKLFRELGYDVEFIIVKQRRFLSKDFFNLYKKAKEADILFSWFGTSFTTTVLSKITGTPSIIVAGGGEIETDPILKSSKHLGGYYTFPWYLKLLVKFTVNFADKVLIVSNYTKKNDYYKIVKNPNDEVVYNAVDTEIFKPIESKKKENYIFTTAFITQQHLYRKGFLQLLEVFRAYPKNQRMP